MVLQAKTATDIDEAFATAVRERIGALVVGTGALLTNRRKHIIALAAQHALPAIYPFREFTADGGLVSYGNDVPDTFRQGGVYAARVLKGDKPADLPVILSTKFETVLNLKTAKAMGIAVSPLMLTRADEVIE
jgi:putative ABC transport system substrate-binding protein